MRFKIVKNPKADQHIDCVKNVSINEHKLGFTVLISWNGEFFK